MRAERRSARSQSLTKIKMQNFSYLPANDAVPEQDPAHGAARLADPFASP
jgi:hypothetical protein